MSSCIDRKYVSYEKIEEYLDEQSLESKGSQFIKIKGLDFREDFSSFNRGPRPDYEDFEKILVTEELEEEFEEVSVELEGHLPILPPHTKWYLKNNYQNKY